MFDVSAILLVVAGPAGSGKSTLCERLIQERPEFSRVVTTTTRPPREGEVNGRDYDFSDYDEVQARITRGEFLEYAFVHGKPGERGRLYGTPKNRVLCPLMAGRSLVMHIDVQGVDTMRQQVSTIPVLRQSMVTVFIRVDEERLRMRMQMRATDTDEEVAWRMKSARAEMREAHKFDFVIDGGTRDHDFAQLIDIIEIAKGRLAVSPRVAV